MVAVISCCILDGHCYLLVHSAWLLLFAISWPYFCCALVALISAWALNTCCYFLVTWGYLLLFPVGLYMVTVISWWALDTAPMQRRR